MSRFVIYEIRNGEEKVVITDTQTLEDAECVRSAIEKARGKNREHTIRIEKVFEIPKR